MSQQHISLIPFAHGQAGSVQKAAHLSTRTAQWKASQVVDACKSPWSMAVVVLGSFLDRHQARLVCLTISHRACCCGCWHVQRAERLGTSQLWVGTVLVMVKDTHCCLMGTSRCSTSQCVSIGLLGHAPQLG